MRRRSAAALALAALLGLAGALPAPTSARQVAQLATVRVRPAIAGVPLLFHGQRYRTDSSGEVRVLATPQELADRGALLRDGLRVPTARLGPALQVRFSRWVGRTASIILLRPVRPMLVDPRGAPVDPSLAPRVTVRGTDGSRVVLPSGRVSWLPAIRAVVRPGGRWRERRVSYAVQEVLAHGANVVHRAQQRFVPARDARVTVHVLFFAVRFTARDALFGTPTGKAIVLRFPDGHSERHAFGTDAQLRLAGLPRGDYTVRVDGHGFSFSRPVALSRSQDVDLQVVTWPDIALVGTALLLVAGLLQLTRRWHVRRSSRTAIRMPARRAHDA